MNRREMGSPDDFEKEWATALAGDLGRYLNYPIDSPYQQYQVFESVKARHVEQILAEAHLTRGQVLEYGCGTAAMSIYLANRGFKSVACDLSLNALRVAKLNGAQHLQPTATSNFESVAGDTFQLPFADETFEVVMSYGLLEHFGPETLPAALAEVWRVLRPGGVFIADIVHGRFSVRRVGAWVSFIGAALAQVVTLRWRALAHLPEVFFDRYYENTLDPAAWSQVLGAVPLSKVGVWVCHPLPPLAVPRIIERLYVRFMLWVRPWWEWYDKTQPRWGQGWGWLYLAFGVKPKKL